MHLVKLRHVVEVARQGSFSRAAAALNLTQPAVTKSVADVEREIGAQVFLRTSRGAKLTDEGAEFVERAAGLVAESDRLFADFVDRRRQADDILRVGVAPPYLGDALAGSVATLIRRRPGLSVDVRIQSLHQATRLLNAGQLDVVIGPTASLSSFPELKLTRLLRTGATFYVRRGHPVLKAPRIDLAALSGCQFVATSHAEPFGPVIARLWPRREAGGRGAHVNVDVLSIAQALVAESDRFAATLAIYAESDAFRERFVALGDLGELPELEVSAAVPRRWNSRRSVTWLLSALREARPAET